MELTVTKFGNVTAIVLPQDMLDRLAVKDGDTVYATETTAGIALSPHNADLAETLEIAKQVMIEDQELLKKLAE